eukprot:TRINITY_DN3482_c0_g1_i1.p1 TRINITY_DN3482_c0_g1~~TRINITY_DN3482_c0_g1_i1.p1  ORF type:complete len:171 (-),score=75.41 TRINITY_DN3482_c0_g1_i1:127-639(-)
MKFSIIFTLFALALIASGADAAAKGKGKASAKKCYAEVCQKVLEKILGNGLHGSSDKLKVEAAVETFCDGARGKDSSMCYEIRTMKRELAQHNSLGLPYLKVCERLGKSNPSVCSIRYPKTIEKGTNLNKLKLRELKQVLTDQGADCRNCIEKSEYVKRVKEVLGWKEEL